MATQLKAAADETATLRKQIQELVQRLGGGVDYPIKEPTENDPLPRPDWILVRQIDIDGTAANGPFVFVGADLRWPYADATLDYILDELRQGRYAMTTAVDEEYYRPLDVNLTDTTLFIFYLNPNRKWRFKRNARAVTLGEFEHMDEQECYYKLRHVLTDSIGTELAPLTGHCRIAYFVGTQASNEFAHPFNLHVEMFYPGGGPKPNTIPIVIDPDIRYPGGSPSE
jgi:hypothetical protein